MSNEVNHVNDWFVYSEYYDSMEIIGFFPNTSIFEVMLKLYDTSNTYVFLTADELKKKGEKLNDTFKNKHVTLNVSLTDGIEDTCIADDVLKAHGVKIKNGKYSFNRNSLEEILKQNV